MSYETAGLNLAFVHDGKLKKQETLTGPVAGTSRANRGRTTNRNNPAMKAVCVQIDLTRVSRQTAARIIAAVKSLATNRKGAVRRLKAADTDHATYATICVQSNDVDALWRDIQCAPGLSRWRERTRRPVIVVCEGKKGWCDYRLLYHYDQSIEVDRVPPTRTTP